MAKIIDPLASERPVGRAVGGPGRMVARGPSEAPGQALRQLGQDLGAAGEEIYRAQKIEEDRINTLRAEEAYTKLRQRQLELTVADGGFARLQGADAVNRPIRQEYGKRFDDAEAEIAKSLSNDEQRVRFKSRANVARLQFNEEMLRHLAQQSDVYAKQVYDGAIGQAQQDALVRWDSPLDIAASLERIRSHVFERAERFQWPDEYRDNELKAQSSKVHVAVITQAIAKGNHRYAQAWYESNKDHVPLETAAALSRAVADGTQKELADGFNARYLANEDNPGVLDQLRREVLQNGQLDDARKNVLVGRIQNRQYVLERRAEVAEQRRLRTIERGVAELNQNTLAGFEPRPEQFEPLIAAAKGTELEGEVARAAQLANSTRAFRNAPPLVQEQTLAAAERGVREEPTKFDRAVVGAWRQIYEAQRRQVKDAPVSFAAQQGIIEPPAPLDLSNPIGQGEAFAERFAIARGMAARYQAPFKPLTPEEVTLLRATLDGATADQKINYFAGLAQASGNDVQGYMGMMAQLAPDDPVSAIAGSHAARGRSEEARLMVRGQQILRPPTKADGKPDTGSLLPMPPETDLRLGFDSYIRDAFAGRAEARNAHYQAAKAVYAALSVDAGDRDTKVLDGGRWEQAMTIAIGPVEKYQGRRVVMPSGYDYSMFRDGLRQRIDELAASGRLDPSWTAQRLRELPIENVGDGRYILRSGDGVVVDQAGRPVMLDFNVSLPFRTSGHGLERREDPTPAELQEAARPYFGAASPRKGIPGVSGERPARAKTGTPQPTGSGMTGVRG